MIIQGHSIKYSKKKINWVYFLFDSMNVIIQLFAILVILIPILMIYSSSFSSELDIIKNGYPIIPREFSLDAYRILFGTNTILLAFRSSFFIATVGTGLSLIATSMMAYVLSKEWLPYVKIVGFLVYFTMLFSGGLIPMFLVIRDLGLYNSYFGVILLILINPFFMILLRNFFAEIPASLEESARLDGASEMKILFSIILPLSLPVLAAVGLFCAVNYWNQWFWPLILLSDRSKWPLQVVLRNMLYTLNLPPEARGALAGANVLIPRTGFQMATLVVTITPIMMVYPFLQKYFAKGILIGAVKG